MAMANVGALLVMATDSKDEGRYPDLVGILSERHYLTKVCFLTSQSCVCLSRAGGP